MTRSKKKSLLRKAKIPPPVHRPEVLAPASTPEDSAAPQPPTGYGTTRGEGY